MFLGFTNEEIKKIKHRVIFIERADNKHKRYYKKYCKRCHKWISKKSCFDFNNFCIFCYEQENK